MGTNRHNNDTANGHGSSAGSATALAGTIHPATPITTDAITITATWHIHFTSAPPAAITVSLIPLIATT
jgi:hypothetical protein